LSLYLPPLVVTLVDTSLILGLQRVFQYISSQCGTCTWDWNSSLAFHSE